MEMNNKVSIEDWAIDNEFANENIIILSETKEYIDDILESTITKSNQDITFQIISEKENEKK